MRLFSYCIPTDDGAAPNPYGGVCTLTICKPVIRRVAKPGDWIIGIGASNVNGETKYAEKLVYAMQVTVKMTLRQYDEHCKKHLRVKIPNLKSSKYPELVGDCIYDYSQGRAKQRLSVHRPKNKSKDLRGKNALLSHFFYYFGNQPIEIPKRFRDLIRLGQGHQSTKNEDIKLGFIDWLTDNFDPNILHGKPQKKFVPKGKDSKDDCAKSRYFTSVEDEEYASQCD
jgi:hypothetical protein